MKHTTSTASPEIKAGLKFFSIHFKGLVEVLAMSGEGINPGEMEVKITPPTALPWHESWNIEHTKWGFERGEYYIRATNAEEIIRETHAKMTDRPSTANSPEPKTEGKQQGQEALCSQGEAAIISVIRILETRDITILSKSKAHDDLKDFYSDHEKLQQDNTRMRELLTNFCNYHEANATWDKMGSLYYDAKKLTQDLSEKALNQ